MASYEVKLLEKEKWKGTYLPISYSVKELYEVHYEEDTLHNVTLKLVRTALEEPFVHTNVEDDMPDKLYQNYFPNAEAYGILEGDTLIAVIECYEEDWSNRMRVTELWTEESHRRKGLATLLMNYVKLLASKRKNRAIILETQTSNLPALDFYFSQGFVFDGIERTCYHNDDIKRKEVRLELVFFF